MTHKISLIVPVYNVEKYLPQCLDSIIGQTYQNLEVILVNDGSADSCAQICDIYAEKHSRIQVIHKKNGGLSDARNAGLQKATGKYIAFIDSDDLIALNFCEILLQAAVNRNAEIVECAFANFEQEVEIIGLEDNIKSSEAIYETESALELLIKGEIKQTVWNKLYSKDIVDGVLFEKNRKHEDEFWTYRIIAKAAKIVKISNVLYFYRQHDESIMGQKYSLDRIDGLDALEERMLFIKNYYPNLFHLAFRSFWFSASAHYQNLTQNRTLDENGIIRKKILKKVAKYKTEIKFEDLTYKERFWLRFFLCVPNIYAQARNYINVGI